VEGAPSITPSQLLIFGDSGEKLAEYELLPGVRVDVTPQLMNKFSTLGGDFSLITFTFRTASYIIPARDIGPSNDMRALSFKILGIP
jgi:hypothetical protein